MKVKRSIFNQLFTYIKFKETAFYEYIFYFEEDSYSQLALQLILFVFFGGILLYIIALSFKILAKFIIII